MIISSDPTLWEALKRFEKRLLAKGLQLRTIRAYLVDATQFLTWLEKTQGCLPEVVSSSIGQDYIDHLRTPTLNQPGGYAAGTISRKLKSLRYLYQTLEQCRNPFIDLTPPVQNKTNAKLSSRQLASLLDAPSESSAAGIRDRALLQMLFEGIHLSKLHVLNLDVIDQNARSVIVPTRSGNQELILLLEPAWERLQRWLIIRKLFAVSTDAVFVSLHWTAGRSQPGSRLSERSMRTVITKYLAEIGAKQPGVNSLLIAKSANLPHNRIPRPIGENT